MQLEVKAPETQSTLAQAKALSIVTQTDAEQGGRMLLEIKALRKQVDASFDPIIETAHTAHKTALTQKKQHTAPLDEAEGIIKRGMAAYATEQQRIQQEEQKRLEELARKEAEEKQNAAAEAAWDAGWQEEAVATLEAPPVVIPKVAPPPPKIAGAVTRKVWKYRIVNEAAIPREYLMVDESKIRRVVTAMAGATNIPGVQAFEEIGIAVR